METPEGLAKHLQRFAAVRPPVLPTPLQYATGISKLLGRDIWVKRDDLTGIALGGNKARKMAFLAAEALDCGADTLVSVGAHQSNHTRTVAAYASMLDMECHLVLGGDEEEPPTANILLSKLLGATLHFQTT